VYLSLLCFLIHTRLTYSCNACQDVLPDVCDDTGEHSTTRLCLQWLFDRRDKIQGAHVMDYGIGSGVLAVAALLMGAASAVSKQHF